MLICTNLRCLCGWQLVGALLPRTQWGRGPEFAKQLLLLAKSRQQCKSTSSRAKKIPWQFSVLGEVGLRGWSLPPTCVVGKFDPAAGWWWNRSRIVRNGQPQNTINQCETDVRDACSSRDWWSGNFGLFRAHFIRVVDSEIS